MLQLIKCVVYEMPAMWEEIKSSLCPMFHWTQNIHWHHIIYLPFLLFQFCLKHCEVQFSNAGTANAQTLLCNKGQDLIVLLSHCCWWVSLVLWHFDLLRAIIVCVRLRIGLLGDSHHGVVWSPMWSKCWDSYYVPVPWYRVWTSVSKTKCWIRCLK